MTIPLVLLVIGWLVNSMSLNSLAIKFMENDGCNIHYSHHVNAGKPTLVLSNSLGTTMAMWEPQLEVLKNHFSVVCYDSRGHGCSDVFPGSYSLDRLGCDVVELLDFLDLDKVHFCGLSIGGMVGQWLAARFPGRINSLVLANTSACIEPSSMWQDRINHVQKEGLLSIWANVLARWLSADFIKNNAEEVGSMKAMFSSIDSDGYCGCCAAIRDMDLRQVANLNKLPTLIIAGAQDLATPIEHSEYLLSQYSDGKLITLDAGHLSNIEQTEGFNQAILDFLVER